MSGAEIKFSQKLHLAPAVQSHACLHFLQQQKYSSACSLKLFMRINKS